MVQLVAGGPEMYDAMIFRESHQGTINFLAQQFENSKNLLVGAGTAFMDKARTVFEEVNSSEAMRRARALARSVGNMWEKDEIKSIWDLADFQSAKPTMQRYLMANPVVRDLFVAQRIDGYSDTYVDMEPGRKGLDHYDYRMVMDGVIVDTPPEKEGEEAGWSYRLFFEEYLEDDRPLDVAEKDMVLSSWEAMNAILAWGEDDPTDPLGGKL